MKKIFRVITCLSAFIGTYYFSFWITAAIISLPFGMDTPSWIYVVSKISTFLLASYIAYVVWKKTSSTNSSKSTLGTYILTGALGLGLFGFLVGFIGPIIFMPGANQGPLLGILITGPGGLVLGAIGGLIFGLIKKHKIKKAAKNDPGSLE